MLEQTLVKLHLANLVYSRDNKIGTFGGTNIGELIKQFESQVKSYWLQLTPVDFVSHIVLCICTLVRPHERWIKNKKEEWFKGGENTLGMPTEDKT